MEINIIAVKNVGMKKVKVYEKLPPCLPACLSKGRE